MKLKHQNISEKNFQKWEWKFLIRLKVGVVGLIKGSKMGRTVALRADIDALPIQETNNIEFKSCNAGVSHACGHDIHITCLLGAAKLLMMQKEHLAGNIQN